LQELQRNKKTAKFDSRDFLHAKPRITTVHFHFRVFSEGQVAGRTVSTENKEVPRFRFLKILRIFEFRYEFFDEMSFASANLFFRPI